MIWIQNLRVHHTSVHHSFISHRCILDFYLKNDFNFWNILCLHTRSPEGLFSTKVKANPPMLNDQMNLWANFFICVDGSVRNSNIYVCKNIEVSSYLVISAEHMNDLLVGVCVRECWFYFAFTLACQIWNSNKWPLGVLRHSTLVIRHSQLNLHGCTGKLHNTLFLFWFLVCFCRRRRARKSLLGTHTEKDTDTNRTSEINSHRVFAR